jgi:hypothetical protein
MFKHTFTITRPNKSAPFWFDTEEANIPALFVDLQNELIAEGKLVSVEQEVSKNGLVFTRTVICNSADDFEYVLNKVNFKFPLNFELRQIYCMDNNHTVERENINF